MASVFLTNCDQTWPRSQQECRRLMRFALAQLMPCSPSHNEPGVSSSSTRLSCTDGINPKGIGDVVKVLKVMSSNTCYRLSLWALLVKCLLGECHKTSLMISKHLCHQATSHYLNKCWCRPLSPYHVTKQYWVKPEYKYFFKKHKYQWICILYHSCSIKCPGWLKFFLMEVKKLPILHHEYHDCWCPGEASSWLCCK